MNYKHLFLALMAIPALVLTSCKNDSESDLELETSDLVGLYVNEIYSSNPDWVELYNSTDKEIDISGFILQDDKGAAEEYVIPENTKIAAKSFYVLEGDGVHFSFGISSSKGDAISLLDKEYSVINTVTVPILEDGQSYARSIDGGSTWTITTTPTKGTSNSITEPDGEKSLQGVIVLNEINSENPDWIELYNTSNESVDLSGLILQDSKGAEDQYVFPEGTTISAKGFLAFDGEDVHFSFGISGNGELISLLDAESTLLDSITIPALESGASYARTTDGGDNWAITTTKTKAAANVISTAPASLIGVLVINEVFTNNQDAQTQISWDDSFDFIELYNNGTSSIDLSGFSMMDEDLDETKKYVFPSGSVINSGEFLTLDTYKNNTNGPVFGLGKSGDKVYLYDAEGLQIDVITTPSFSSDQVYSYGRETDGASTMVVFTEVSKNSSNNGKATTTL